MFPAVWAYKVSPQNFECEASALHLNSEDVRARFEYATLVVQRELQSLKQTENTEQLVAVHAITDDRPP